MKPVQPMNFPSDQELSEMSADLRSSWQNKKLVHDFFSRVINDHDLTAADQFLTEYYIQHNPGVPTGRDGFKAYFTNLFKTFPQTKLHILKVLADRNEVVTYCEYRFANRLTTLKMKTIDIWRIEDGLIAEHWDAVEGYGIRDRVLLSLQSRPNRSNSWYKVS